MTEHRVAKMGELAEGQPHGVDAGGTSVVLVRQGDRVHALAGACPHKGVPMEKGAVAQGRIVCAAHRAAFDLSTGEPTAPPACEGLAVYEVRIDGDDVHVTLPRSSQPHPLPHMSGRGGDPRHFMIVGSGAAGWRAAETLRRERFAGRVTVVSDDGARPYDRTDLSKAQLKGADAGAPWMRDEDAIAAMGIEVLEGTAQSLDADARTLTVDGQTLPWDALLVATGCAARRLDVPGAHLPGVHSLRSLSDARALDADLSRIASGGRCRVAIVGGGFVGLEAAAALSGRDGVEVAVILAEAKPQARLFGTAFADRLLAEHRAAGVRFVTEAKVTGFDGDGRVSQVRLDGSGPVEADVVIVAVGAAPRTGWLPFATGGDGGVEVDAQLSAAPGVWIAGDIARLPTPWGKVRIEHWRFAQETGELAARNMLGQARAYEGTPFFWTMQQAKGSYTYTGHAEGFDSISGDPGADGSFVAAYTKDGRVPAVLAFGFDDRVTLLEPAMAGRGPLPSDDPAIPFG